MKLLLILAVAAFIVEMAVPFEVVHMRCLERTGTIVSSGSRIPVLSYVDRDDMSEEEARALGCSRRRFRVRWGMRELIDATAMDMTPADDDR